MLNKRFNYEVDYFDYIIDINVHNLKGKFVNHILILGYKAGIDYIIKSIRQLSNVPICILASKTNYYAIKKAIATHNN